MLGIKVSPPPTANGRTIASAPTAAPTMTAKTKGARWNAAARQSSAVTRQRLNNTPNMPRPAPSTMKLGSSRSGTEAVSILSGGAVPPTSSMPSALAADAAITPT